MNPTIRQIVEEYLKANGYGGLYGHLCCCEVDGLMPCLNHLVGECSAGYLVEYKDGKECPCGEGCDWHVEEKKK